MRSRFTVRLRREIAANPKKAGILGLLLAVAIWFWIPLVAKWFIKPEMDVKDGLPTPNVAAPSPAVAGSGTVAVARGTTDTALSLKYKLPVHPWRRLVAWIEQDS